MNCRSGGSILTKIATFGAGNIDNPSLVGHAAVNNCNNCNSPQRYTL